MGRGSWDVACGYLLFSKLFRNFGENNPRKRFRAAPNSQVAAHGRCGLQRARFDRAEPPGPATEVQNGPRTPSHFSGGHFLALEAALRQINVSLMPEKHNHGLDQVSQAPPTALPCAPIPGVLIWTVSDMVPFLNNLGSQTLPNGTNRRVYTHTSTLYPLAAQIR